MEAPILSLLRRSYGIGLLLAVLLGGVLRATDSPGKLGFHVFPAAPGQDLGSASRPVYDGKSGFWFYDSGNLWRFDARGYRQLGTADGLPEAPVDKAFPDPATGLWFLAGTGGFVLRTDGVHAIPGFQRPEGAPNRNVLAIRNEGLAVILKDRLRIYHPSGQVVDLPLPGDGDWVKGWKDPNGDHRLLVGDSGLARWDGHAWRIQPTAPLLEGRGEDVLRTRDGALWVRSDRDLARIEPRPTHFGPRMGLTRNSFVTVEEDPFGRVWTNGPEGLVCVDGDRLWRIGEQEGLIGYQSYWPITFDPQGNLWTICAAGFEQLKGAFLWSVQEQPFGLPRTMVFLVQRRKRDGLLYAGTHDGLYRRIGARWEEVRGTERWAPFTFAERGNGEFWCGGNPPGPHDLSLFRLSPAGRPEHPEVQGLPRGAWTYSLAWTSDDTLWCNTAKGLYRIHAQGASFRAEPATLPGAPPAPPVAFLELSPDGTLWTGTAQGAYWYQDGRWTLLGPSDGLLAASTSGAFLGPGGEWWLLHDDAKAITRLALVRGRGWQVVGGFDAHQPLTASGAVGGWTDPKGVVWMLTDSDILRWDGRRAEHFSQAFGVPIDDFYPSICGEPDGTFWIGSISGVVRCDPRYYRPIPPPPALVEGPATDGQGHPLRAGAQLQPRTGATFELELPLVEGIEDLTIQTRLQGLDAAWHPLEGNTLRLPGLAPGTYQLQARAARRDGAFGPLFSFPFTVLPPWYLRTSALALGLLLALALGALVVRWRTWSLRKDRMRLEDQVLDRTRDLTRANEALTQALTEVRTLKGLVPICSYCKRIRSDEGFWRQLELVLAERTEAKLSHGICPDCAEQVKAAWEAERDTFDPYQGLKSPNS